LRKEGGILFKESDGKCWLDRKLAVESGPLVTCPLLYITSPLRTREKRKKEKGKKEMVQRGCVVQSIGVTREVLQPLLVSTSTAASHYGRLCHTYLLYKFVF
ncbi:unnamed protein product, partial [Discosporangium mesarthrocarpum]